MKSNNKYKNLFRDMDKSLLIITIILIIFGTLNIVTASSREAIVVNNVNLYYYFFKHIFILFVCLIVFFIIIKVPTKKYYRFMILIYGIVFSLNLYLILKGVSTRGASNWIKLPFIKVQPSEFAKPVLIVYLSMLFEKYNKRLNNKKEKHASMIWEIIGFGLMLPILVFLQKDLGTSIILLMIFSILFLSSPISKSEKFKAVVLTLIIGVIGLLTMMSFSGYILSEAQLSRFDFYNPCSKYGSSGYQVCNAFIAINSGGLKGVGIGKSTQKYSYIPEPHTDMVFSIISEEDGFITGIIILIFYIIIIAKILSLSSKVKNIKNRYICLGAATYIFAHILINLGGLFGIIPLTGVPLPFLSYGGSYMLSLICVLSIVQRVHIEYKNEKIKLT